MDDALLTPDPSYDPGTQAVIGTMAAQLDDQTKHLTRAVEGMSVEALEWQPASGYNTVGMLLAHIPIAEAWWLLAAAQGITSKQDADDILVEAIGIKAADDGMPLAADGGHPKALTGQPAASYVGRITAARIRTHGVLHAWTDDTLGDAFDVREHRISRRWVLYHILEHQVAHLGQIRVLKRQLADAGLITT